MRTHFLRVAFTVFFFSFAHMLTANMILRDQYCVNGHIYSGKVEKKNPSFGKNNILHSIKAVKHLRAWKQRPAKSRKVPNDNRELEKHALYGFWCSVAGISALMYFFALAFLTGEGLLTGTIFILFGFYALMIAGVVLGIIGLTKIKKQPQAFRNRWQAVTAIILGALFTTYVGLMALLITGIVIWSKKGPEPQKAKL